MINVIVVNPNKAESLPKKYQTVSIFKNGYTEGVNKGENTIAIAYINAKEEEFSKPVLIYQIRECLFKKDFVDKIENATITWGKGIN